MKKKIFLKGGAIFLVLALILTGCFSYYKELLPFFISETVTSPFTNKGTASIQPPLKGCDIYQVGAGVGDVTEYPSDQLNGGYVDSAQKTRGIHTRQMARAFIIVDKKTLQRICIITLDDWATTIETREEVVIRLNSGKAKDQYGNKMEFFDSKGEPLYNINNIMIIASHSHNGVMGDAERRQYNISAGGHTRELLDIAVKGICEAIAQAHHNLQDATIEYAKGKLINEYNVTKNRSVTAMLNNPEAPLAKEYTPESFQKLAKEEVKGLKHIIGKAEELRNHESAADKNMYLFRFKSYPEGKDIGLLNWFSIHGTSISASNPMISGDNKAVSSQMTESIMGRNPNPDPDFMAGSYLGQENFSRTVPNPGFVAGFAQGALGDVDPKRNIYRLDRLGYTLEEEMINVVAASRAQSAKALELYYNPQIAVKGSISAAMNYVSLNKTYVSKKFAYLPHTYKARTFPPAAGWSMAAGGEIHQPNFPGAYEGMRADNSVFPIVSMVRSILSPFLFSDCSEPSKSQSLPQVFSAHKEFLSDHYPKPVLFASGNGKPSWMDTDIPFQIFRIGNFALAACPFETTTYSAYRIKDSVRKAFEEKGIFLEDILYSGNTNGYVSYMATPHEYELQHYEGACTCFGINQVPACQQEFSRLVGKLVNGETGRCNYDPAWIVSSPDRVPKKKIVYSIPLPHIDFVPARKTFGMQVAPLKKKDYTWLDTFEIDFYAANMNANIFHNDSFFYIQRFIDAENGWMTVSSDNDYQTNLVWKPKNSNFSTSTVIWRIPLGTAEGKYRVVFKGSFSRDGFNHQTFSDQSEPFFVKTPDLQKVFISSGFTQKEKTATLEFKEKKDEPLIGDQITLRLKEDDNNVAILAEVVINGNKKLPVRNLSANGTAINIFLPDLKIHSVAVNFLLSEPATYVPELEVFGLSNSNVSNEPWPGHFTLFCR